MTRASARRMMNEGTPRGGGVVVYVFQNVFMGRSFRGLSEIAEDVGFPLEELKPGQYLLFFNAKRTGCAILGMGENGKLVVSKHRNGDEAFASIEAAVKPIVTSFLNNEAVDFDEAVNRALFGALSQGRASSRREVQPTT